MGFPPGVDIKYGAFTLCYSVLLRHLDDLELVLSRDTHNLKTDLIARFDGALQEQVYNGRPRDLEQAVQILLARIDSERLRVETINSNAARIIEAIMGEIEQEVPHWDYATDIERHRVWGERLSRFFYQGTPWSKTQYRLSTCATVAFEYSTEDVASMAYYEEYDQAGEGESEDNVILIRFSFEDDFSHYLAYPFFLFHEYASHVHGADSKSYIFDDGWMMFAIHKCLTKNYDSLPSTYRLKRDQNHAISEHLPSGLSEDIMKRYYLLALEFYDWLELWAPGLFRRLTWELAGYPLTRENPYFLADFIERLRYEYLQRPDDLRRKMAKYTNVDSLLMGLTPP